MRAHEVDRGALLGSASLIVPSCTGGGTGYVGLTSSAGKALLGHSVSVTKTGCSDQALLA